MNSLDSTPKGPLSPASEPQPRNRQSSSRSPFASGTVELVLHFLPAEASPDERRIRHMVSLNGKTLAVGTQRASDLPVLLSSLSGLSTEGILAHLEEYIAHRQLLVKESEAQRSREKKAVQPASPVKAANGQRSSPGISASQTKSESPGLSVARPALPTKQAPSSEAAEVPQQLSLF